MGVLGHTIDWKCFSQDPYYSLYSPDRLHTCTPSDTGGNLHG